MSEIVVHQPTELAVSPTGPVTEGLDVWAARLGHAAEIGQALCGTTFVPKNFQGKPEEAAAAILYGHSIGFDPMQSLQGIHVISGKPSLAARSMVALVLSRGHKIWTASKTDASVTVCGQRAGSDEVTSETWDAARAKKAGYTSNAKYATDPQAMLYARAASDVCRQIAPDVLAGLAYSREEMELVQPTRPSPGTANRPRLTIREAAAATTRQEPPANVDTSTGEIIGEIVEDTPSELMASTDQLREIAGILDCSKDEILAGISAVLGREISSGSDLTRAEAMTVIANLTSDEEVAA
jgi:hypothetical protein